MPKPLLPHTDTERERGRLDAADIDYFSSLQHRSGRSEWSVYKTFVMRTIIPSRRRTQSLLFKLKVIRDKISQPDVSLVRNFQSLFIGENLNIHGVSPFLMAHVQRIIFKNGEQHKYFILRFEILYFSAYKRRSF